jgi:soluble lytic murein transglycosylase-like protein
MPKFHSLRTVYPPLINDESRELSPALRTVVTKNAQDIFNQEIELAHAPVTPALSGEQHFQAEPISPLYAAQPAQSRITTPRVAGLSAQYIAPQVKTEKALQPLRPTQALQSHQPQSLLAALQSTMEPKINRLPVLIPAEMKKIKQQPAEALSPATRRTISRFKQGIVLGAMVAFLFLTAFSFGPANQSIHAFPLLDNLIQQSQEQAPNSAISQKSAQPIVAAPGMPNIPQSDLVTLAQQDAIKYGISPVYFVRQIYAESGFNPNAYSPAGAVGIAQFLPSTAAGLGINPYDPVSALDGAAKYMARLSNQFGGDYAKALAAYNAGSGTVQNAINRGGANWLSLMPYETQIYINKITG